MGVAAFEVRRVDEVRDWLDLVPAHARATHPRVNLPVESAPPRAARDPAVDARSVTERRRQPVGLVGVEQIGSGRHEHEHRPRDPRRPQLGPLLDRRHAVSPWVDRLQGLGDGYGSHPVGIRSRPRREPCARHACDGTGIFDDRGEVHFDPGARVAPARKRVHRRANDNAARWLKATGKRGWLQSQKLYYFPVMDTPAPDSALARALALVRDLRSRCPWDHAQTRATLRPYLVEEALELDQALRSDDPVALRDELGDLLLHLAFQIVIGEEKREFDAETVTRALEEKMWRRHPHLFGDSPTPDHEGWERVKKRERGAGSGTLRGLPPSLTPLLMAFRLQERAAGVGFDWPDAKGPLEKVKEELDEVERATG